MKTQIGQTEGPEARRRVPTSESRVEADTQYLPTKALQHALIRLVPPRPLLSFWFSNWS